MQLHFYLWDPFNFINSLLPTSSDQVSGGELWKFQGVINQSTNQLLYGCVNIHSTLTWLRSPNPPRFGGSNDRSCHMKFSHTTCIAWHIVSVSQKYTKSIKQLWFTGVVVCDIWRMLILPEGSQLEWTCWLLFEVFFWLWTSQTSKECRQEKTWAMLSDTMGCCGNG